MERLWRGLGNDETATEAMRIVLRLVILTGQRETEVVSAKVSEVVFDIGNPLWRISRGRMKNKKREQVVPLSEEAAMLFCKSFGDRGREGSENWLRLPGVS
jgi:integrase